MALFWAIVLAVFFPLAAMAEGTGKFGSFVKDDLSAPGTVKKIADPTGSAPTSEVYWFSLPAGYCNSKKYDAGSTDSDCTWNSSRSQMRQTAKSQPKESWYGWYTYFPKDFAYGSRQTKGHYEFAYWTTINARTLPSLAAQMTVTCISKPTQHLATMIASRET